tara:strand:+ start:1164 stop:1307 length:144 start_codon:yes stop_codon:yes gene_type:complete
MSELKDWESLNPKEFKVELKKTLDKEIKVITPEEFTNQLLEEFFNIK